MLPFLQLADKEKLTQDYAENKSYMFLLCSFTLEGRRLIHMLFSHVPLRLFFPLSERFMFYQLLELITHHHQNQQRG